MARPQQFDQKQVLNSAMQLFWLKGYANTSIKDLTDATSLMPGSLYGAFKSKRGIFVEALDSYFENIYTDVSEVLESDEPALKRIRLFFEYVLHQMEKDQAAKSCLMVNTLLEMPANDEEINHRITAMFEKMEELFCQVLKEAQINGDLVTGGNPESLAKMLMSGLMGLQVYNKMQTGQLALTQIVNNLLSILENQAQNVDD